MDARKPERVQSTRRGVVVGDQACLSIMWGTSGRSCWTGSTSGSSSTSASCRQRGQQGMSTTCRRMRFSVEPSSACPRRRRILEQKVAVLLFGNGPKILEQQMAAVLLFENAPRVGSRGGEM